MEAIIAIAVGLGGVLLLGWPKIAAWIRMTNRTPGSPLAPTPTCPAGELIDGVLLVSTGEELLTEVLALRRLFSGDQETVDLIDEFIIPAAIRKLT